MSTQDIAHQMKYPPPGRWIDVGGIKMHLLSLGEGSPTVVMEAAIWDFSLTWTLVQPGVAEFAHAIVYDRAGLGWSESSPRPRTAAAMVEELRALLAAADIKKPYVLVGQSFSGLLVRLYAFTYPEDVAGMVLVDSAHEDQYQRFPEMIRNAFAPIKDMQLQQLRQVRDLIATQGPDAAPPLLPIPQGMPADAAAMYRWLSAWHPSRLDTMIGEIEALEESQAQLRAARSATLGDIPLIVLSHGQPQPVPGMPDEVNQEYEDTWQQMQMELVALSTKGRRVVAEQSGHMIHHDQPELVIDAIRQVVATLC